MKTVAVIGGGAAGLAAALAASREGADVTVLESEKKPGKKLLLTGAGRCNLGNDMSANGAYFGGDPAFAENLIHTLRPMLRAFLADAGILIRKIDGLWYPYNEEASSVLDAFLHMLKKQKVTVRPNTKVTGIRKEGDAFRIETAGYAYHADAVVLAAGTAAGFGEGVSGGYGLATSLGHALTEVRPGLTGLILCGFPFSKTAGVRVRGAVTLLDKGKPIGREEGQIQFNAYGLSGIPVMNLSSRAGAILLEGREPVLSLSYLPDDEIDPDAFPETILPKKLARTLREVYKDALPDLRDHRFAVKALRPAAYAQCMAGGIPTAEVSPSTMASAKTKGLYLAGEMLDIDGICGGYNLMFAFLTGILAGRSAAC